MKSLALRLLVFLLCLFPCTLFAHDVTITGTQNFASLDGSSSDHDGSANGVFTVNDGNLIVNGVVNCNDDSTTSACAMAFVVSGNMTMNAGSALYAENRSGGGTGGAITLTVGGDLALNGNALVSTDSKSSSGATGGNITANVGGDVTLAATSTIDAGSANAKGGDITIAAGGIVSADGNVYSGPSRTLLSTRLTGSALDGGTSNQIGGAITISSTTFAEPAILIGGNANIVSQGETQGAGPVTIDGCGIVLKGLVAALSRKDATAKVAIRSGKDILVDARDLGVAGGTRNGRVRADAPSGTAVNKGVDVFASETITIYGPAAASTYFAVTSMPGIHDSKSYGGLIRITSIGDAVIASGNVIDDGHSASGDTGGTIEIAAKADVNLATAVIRAIGDFNTNNSNRGGGTIHVRSYSGNVIWTNGVGEVRPVGSTSNLPLADQGAIVLTACGTVDTTGTSFPVMGTATSMFPETHTGVCSPAAPSLPAGVPPLVTCNTPPVANDVTEATNEDNSVTVHLSGSDVDGDSLTFSIVTPPANGSLGPIVSTGPTTAEVLYTPNLNFNGTDSFVFQANDGNGGTDTATATIVVAPVNDPPSFLAGPSVTVLEDAGAQTYANWATSISPGPADESGQSVTFTVTNDNPALFSVQPSVAPNGTLTFTAAANAYGSANITITAQDNGGTANGGNDTSAPQTSSITVTAVNDEPSFVAGGDQTVLEDAGPQTVSGWATAISAGPNESGQTLTFVTSNDNTALFSAQPSVAANGTLTYTPAADANGAATVTIYLMDDGGTANGGDDTSPSQTFTITVTAVNDAPSFTSGGNVAVLEDSGAYSAAWASAISAGPADESGQTLSFSVSNDNNALFAAQPSIDASGVLTFTPAANAYGSATVTVTLSDNGGTANGGADTSAAQTFTLTVNAVNDEPAFTSGGNVTVLEDSGAYSAAWATGISAGPNESGQTLTFFASNDNNALFASQPSVSASGVLTFTPAANAYGTATVTIYLMDDGGTANGGDDTSPSVTFTITVDPVNDAPSFTPGGNVTVYEDSGAYSASWATAISAGPANESSQTVAFVATNDNNALFTVQPSVDPSGLLTFTPALNATGTATITIYAQDNGGTANGGVDVSPSVTFTITVSDVNDPPSFTPGADQTALEDGGPQTVLNWATAISAGPGESQNVTFVVSNDNNTLFSVQPAIAPDGTLTYTAAPNANGVATVTVYAQDDGGTANGGDDTSNSVTFTITVLAVNDAPSFTGGGDVSVLEDSGAFSAAWATAISAGPADESTQSLHFTIDSNSNPSLFSAGPAIAANGTLTFTPAPNAFGSATIVITLHDDGGTANGGADTSTSYTFTITVGAVNDAPSFTSGGDVSVNEDSGAYAAAWASAISAGPNESGQSVAFLVSNNNNALFSAQPSISPAGVLTFTPAPNAYGTALVTVTLQDNGGTANGGVDTSAPVTFTITVVSVNDPPTVAGESYDTIGNTMLQVAASQTQSPSVFVSGTLLSNDSDVDGPNPLTASLVSASAGAVVTVNADGTFTYVPAAGFTAGNDTFTYSVTDGQDTATGTVTITVKNRVWYVKNDGAGTSGRSHDPFATLAAAESASAAGDTIYIFTGDGTTTGQNAGFTMKNNQRLLGAGVALTVPVSVNGGPNPTVLLAAGARPLIGNGGGSGVTATNVVVEIAGMNISAFTSGVRVLASGVSSGSANIHDMGVVVSANAFDIDGTSTGLLTILANNVSGSSTSNAFDARTTAGELRIALDNSTFTASSGDGIYLNQSVAGTLVVTSLLNDSVSGNTSGNGITATNVRFDAIPGGVLDVVSGGALAIGSAGNGVGGFGISMAGSSGHVSFTSLSVVADGAAAVAISGTGPLASLTGTQVSAGSGSLTATAGAALSVTNATLALTLGNISSANSATSGIALTNVSGSVSASAGSITNAAGADVNIAGSSANVAYGGSITDDLGSLVTISSSTGAMSFGGAITDGNDGDGAGITLTNNAGGSISFTGGLTLSTGASPAFTATGGGTLSVTGTNTAATTTATAVNIANTTIGGAGVTFQSISSTASGSNTVIVLNTTGSGAFTVTGVGTADASGGTISNKVDVDAITLRNTGGLVTLRNMLIQDITKSTDATDASETRSGVDAIHGENVNGGLALDNTDIKRISDSGINGTAFSDPSAATATTWNGLTITNSVIEDTNRFSVANRADSTNEGAVHILGLKGVVTVTGSTFQRAGHGLDIDTDTSGTLDMTVQSSSFLEINKEMPTQPLKRVGLFGIDVRQLGSLSSVVRIGDPAETNGALGNVFTNNGVASIRVVSEVTATGNLQTVIAKNQLSVTDHSSPGVPAGSFTFNIPQGGVNLRPRGTGRYEAIVAANTLNQLMHADGGLGELSIIIEGGDSEFIVRNNVFQLPWDAPVELRADGFSTTQTSAAVHFQNNQYVDGLIGSGSDDLGGPSQSPFTPFYVQVRNGGKLDLTAQGEVFPQHDTFSGFSQSYVTQTTSAGDLLNLFLQNCKSPAGYRLSQGGGTFNLYRNGSAGATAQQVLQDNGNTGGGGSDNTVPPSVTTSGTITLSGTAPVLPSISIP